MTIIVSWEASAVAWNPMARRMVCRQISCKSLPSACPRSMGIISPGHCSSLRLPLTAPVPEHPVAHALVVMPCLSRKRMSALWSRLVLIRTYSLSKGVVLPNARPCDDLCCSPGRMPSPRTFVLPATLRIHGCCAPADTLPIQGWCTLELTPLRPGVVSAHGTCA